MFSMEWELSLKWGTERKHTYEIEFYTQTYVLFISFWVMELRNIQPDDRSTGWYFISSSTENRKQSTYRINKTSFHPYTQRSDD